MSSNKYFLAIALFVCVFGYGQTTYYVNQSSGANSNNGTSVSSPFRTVNYALTQVGPGDTISIIGEYHNSSYDPNYTYGTPSDAHLWHAENTIRINNVNGDANDGYITIKGYDNNTVIKGDGANIIRVTNSSYLKFENLNIEGEVDRIPLSTANALQFVYIIDDSSLNGTVTNPEPSDIHYRNEDETNDNDDIVEETDTYTDISNDDVKRPTYIDTRGFYVSTSEHIEISNNIIHHTPGGGMRVSDSKYVTITKNEIYRCSARSYSGTHALVVTKTLPINSDGNSITISKNLVHHNYNEQYSWSPQKTIINPRIDEGKGISLQRNNKNDWKNGQGRILVANNICYWNGFSGLHSNKGYRIDFINNTAFMNSYTNTITYGNSTQQGNNIGISSQSSTDVKMINNISVIDTDWNGKALSANGNNNLTVKNNLIYGINGTAAISTEVDDVDINTIENDPLFVNAPTQYQDETYNFDFHIQNNSPAINQADANDAPTDDYFDLIRGNNPDIGAAEYSNLCNSVTTTWNGSAWDNGTPDQNTRVIIDGDYNVNNNGTFEACSITINANKKLIITSNKYVLIKKDIENNGKIIIRNKGSLVQIDDNASVSNGQYIVKKTTSDYTDYDYIYWSSPLDNEQIGSVLAESPQNLIYKYNTANFLDLFSGNYPQSTGNPDTYDDNGDDWVHVQSTEVMQPGVGYIAMGKDSEIPYDFNNIEVNPGQEVIFNDGKINNGIINVPVFQDKYHEDGLSGADSFHTNGNLLGNPYPSAIDVVAFRLQNPSILQGTFYIWTHDTQVSANSGPNAYDYTADDYAIMTVDSDGNFSKVASSSGTHASRYIASCQGFMADVTGNGNVAFNNAMRVADNNNHFIRPAHQNRDGFWLNLTGNNNLFRQIYIGFYDTATDGYQDGQDGARIENGNNPDFYTLIQGENSRFAIQNLAVFTENKTINAGIEITEAGNYEISIDDTQGVFDQGQNIYLEDLQTGTIHNLSQSPYQFYSDITDNQNRFVIRFNSTTSIDNESLEKLITIYPNPSKQIFNISVPFTENLEVELYSIQGKQLLKTNKQVLNLTNFAKGIYFVKIKTGHITAVKKIILE